MDYKLWEDAGFGLKNDKPEQKSNRSFFDNFGDALTAIGANFQDVRGSESLGDLREELADRTISPEQFNRLAEQYEIEYAKRQAARDRYKEAHDNLVADDSFLKNIDQMGGTLEGMAAQGIGTAVGAGLGFLAPVVGGTAIGAKVGNAAGAIAGAYLDARSVALQAQEDVLDAGGTWEQAKQAYDETLKKASLTTLPETAVDIAMGNRMVSGVLGSKTARRLAGSTIGRAGSAVLDPAARLGTKAAFASGKGFVGRGVGIATDTLLQGATEAGQEVTQDYIANREAAKALGQQDNEYSLGGFKDYALSDQGLETMKTAGIMGALFGGVGGAVSSGQYLSRGAETNVGIKTHNAFNGLQNERGIKLDPQARAEQEMILSKLRGFSREELASWSDADIVAESAVAMGDMRKNITGEESDISQIREAVDTVARLSKDQNSITKEGEITEDTRDLLTRMGFDEKDINDWFTSPTDVLAKARQVEQEEQAKQKQAEQEGEKPKTTIKVSPETGETLNVKQGEVVQGQKPTEQTTDTQEPITEKTTQNGLGEQAKQAEQQGTIQQDEETEYPDIIGWERDPDFDESDGVEYEGATYYNLRDNNILARIEPSGNGYVVVKLDGEGNVASDSKNMYFASKKEAANYLQQNKGETVFQGSDEQAQAELPSDGVNADAGNSGTLVGSVEDLYNLSQQEPDLLNPYEFAEFVRIKQHMGAGDLDVYFDKRRGYTLGEDGQWHEVNASATPAATAKGRAIIQLYKGGDLGSAIHEIAHTAYWKLSDADKRTFGYYAIKTQGKYIADSLDEDYTPEFENRLLKLASKVSQNVELDEQDKQLQEKILSKAATNQIYDNLITFYNSKMNGGAVDLKNLTSQQQRAIEERWAWEMSQWYVEGYSVGVAPSNIIERIKQRGCESIAKDLNSLARIWQHIHHKDNNEIENIYRGGQSEEQKQLQKVQFTNELERQAMPNVNMPMNFGGEQAIQYGVPTLGESYNDAQEYANLYNELERRYANRQKMQGLPSADGSIPTVQNRPTQTEEKKTTTGYKEAIPTTKQNKEEEKLVDIIKNRKSGWEKALERLAEINPKTFRNILYSEDATQGEQVNGQGLTNQNESGIVEQTKETEQQEKQEDNQKEYWAEVVTPQGSTELIKLKYSSKDALVKDFRSNGYKVHFAAEKENYSLERARYENARVKRSKNATPEERRIAADNLAKEESDYEWRNMSPEERNQWGKDYLNQIKEQENQEGGQTNGETENTRGTEDLQGNVGEVQGRGAVRTGNDNRTGEGRVGQNSVEERSEGNGKDIPLLKNKAIKDTYNKRKDKKTELQEEVSDEEFNKGLEKIKDSKYVSTENGNWSFNDEKVAKEIFGDKKLTKKQKSDLFEALSDYVIGKSKEYQKKRRIGNRGKMTKALDALHKKYAKNSGKVIGLQNYRFTKQEWEDIEQFKKDYVDLYIPYEDIETVQRKLDKDYNDLSNMTDRERNVYKYKQAYLDDAHDIVNWLQVQNGDISEEDRNNEFSSYNEKNFFWNKDKKKAADERFYKRVDKMLEQSKQNGQKADKLIEKEKQNKSEAQTPVQSSTVEQPVTTKSEPVNTNTNTNNIEQEEQTKPTIPTDEIYSHLYFGDKTGKLKYNPKTKKIEYFAEEYVGRNPNTMSKVYKVVLKGEITPEQYNELRQRYEQDFKKAKGEKKENAPDLVEGMKKEDFMYSAYKETKQSKKEIDEFGEGNTELGYEKKGLVTDKKDESGIKEKRFDDAIKGKSYFGEMGETELTEEQKKEAKGSVEEEPPKVEKKKTEKQTKTKETKKTTSKPKTTDYLSALHKKYKYVTGTPIGEKGYRFKDDEKAFIEGFKGMIDGAIGNKEELVNVAKRLDSWFQNDPTERNRMVKKYLSQYLADAAKINAKQDTNVRHQLSNSAEKEQIRQRYKGTEQWMKAPNGKKTNLTEEQWLTVRTPQFKKWFGDWENDPKNSSKVVDKNGEPLVVYHGTSSKFNIFKRMSHFGDNIEQALDRLGYYHDQEDFEDVKTSELEKRATSNGNQIMRLFLNIRNPLILDVDFGSWDKEDFDKHGVSIDGHDGVFYENWHEGKQERELNDGETNNAYIAFKSNQIKSVDNNGNFDVNNPDIRFMYADKGTQNQTFKNNKNVNNQLSDKAQEAQNILDKAFPNTRFQFAWHGTEYDFNEFSLKHLLSGEGALAHGWGLYFAKDPYIGLDYARKLGDSTLEYSGKVSKKYQPIIKDLSYFIYLRKKQKHISTERAIESAIKEFEKNIEFYSKGGGIDPQYSKRQLAKYKKYVDFLKNNKDEFIFKSEGKLIQVDIPDNNVLLRENAPFDKQPKMVQQKLIKFVKNELPSVVSDISERELYKHFDAIFGTDENNIYTELGEYLAEENPIIGEEIGFVDYTDQDENISRKLNKYGIKGISYLGETDGECFVIFDDKAIDIISKFKVEEGKYKLEKVDNKRNREVDKEKAQKKLQKHRAKQNDFRFQLHSEEGMKKADTNSPAFKNWFEGSILKNKDGSPKVYYRGLNGEYDVNKQSPVTWVSPSIDQAYSYSDNSKHVYPVYVSVKNPANIGNSMSQMTMQQFVDNRLNPLIAQAYRNKTITKEQGLQFFDTLDELANNNGKDFKRVYEWYNNNNEIIDILKECGYDALLTEEDNQETYGVFNKGDVKSVYNKGTFDRNNPDIRFQAVAVKDTKALESKYEQDFLKVGKQMGYTENEINHAFILYATGNTNINIDTSKENNKAERIFVRINNKINNDLWKSGQNVQRGLDGKWRTYIDDRNAKLKSGILKLLNEPNKIKEKTFYLGQIMTHLDLYKYNKKLKGVKVQFKDFGSKSNKLGQVTQNGTIELNYRKMNTEKDLMSTLLHEIQHIIQKIEGFARGGNGEEFLDPRNQTLFSALTKNILNDVEKIVKFAQDNEYPLTQKQADKILNMDEFEFEKYLNENSTIGVILNDYIELKNKKFDLYKNLLGEIEARDASLRYELDDEHYNKIKPLDLDYQYRKLKENRNNISVRFQQSDKNQEKKLTKKQEKKLEIQKEIKEAKEKGQTTDTYKDVYSVSFTKSAQESKVNQEKMKYFDARKSAWERHEENGRVTYTRTTPFEHHQKVITYNGINDKIVEQKPKTKYRQWMDFIKEKISKNLFNDQYALYKLATDLGLGNAYMRMVVTQGYAQKTGVALEKGIMYNGKRTRAMNDIAREIGEEKQSAFCEYAIAKHLQDIYNRPNNKIEQKYDKDEVDAVIKRVEASEDYKLFERCRKDLVEYNHACFHTLVDGGIITEQEFQRYVERDKNYVPLSKVMDKEDFGFNSIQFARSMVNVGSPVRKLGTSKREIKNIFAEMQRRTAIYYAAAARNKAGQIFVNEICGTLDKMYDGDTVSRGASIIRKVKVKEEDGKLITRPDTDKQIFYVNNGGKHEFYQVSDPEIYRALRHLDEEQLHIINGMLEKMLSAPAGLVRATATATPDFGIRNIIRDNLTAFYTSEHGFIPIIDALWGMREIKRNGEFYQRYIDQVGEYGLKGRGELLKNNTYKLKDYRESLKDEILKEFNILTDNKRSLKDRTKALLRMTIGAPFFAFGEQLERFNMYLEQGTRVGEFKNAKMGYNGLIDRITSDLSADINKARQSDIIAAYKAQDVTLYFSQHGLLGGKFNRFVPFLNASLLGAQKFVNAVDLAVTGKDSMNQKNTRLRKELLFKVALSTAFAIGLSAAGHGDEDYDEAPDYEKDTFWIFPNGIRIPKDEVFGRSIGTAVQRAFDQYYKEGKVDALKTFESIAGMFKPNTVLPTVLDMFYGSIYNKDSFTGREIVPEYMTHRVGYQQKDIYTGNLAADFTEVLYKAFGINLSAKRVDWALQKNLTNAKKYLDAVYDVKEKLTDPEHFNEKMARGYDKNDSTGSFVGGLRDNVPPVLNLVTGTFATNRSQYQSISDFEKKYYEIKQIADNDKDIPMTREQKRKWQRYEKAYKEYTKLRKQLKAIRSNASLSGTDKREKAEPIFKKQIKLAEWAEG